MSEANRPSGGERISQRRPRRERAVATGAAESGRCGELASLVGAVPVVGPGGRSQPLGRPAPGLLPPAGHPAVHLARPDPRRGGGRRRRGGHLARRLAVLRHQPAGRPRQGGPLPAPDHGAVRRGRPAPRPGARPDAGRTAPDGGHLLRRPGRRQRLPGGEHLQPLLFPLAFLFLVLAKAYAIAKSALVPTVVADDAELVEANSKLGLLAGIAGFVVVLPAVLLKLIDVRDHAVLRRAAVHRRHRPGDAAAPGRGRGHAGRAAGEGGAAVGRAWCWRPRAWPSCGRSSAS